MVLQKLIFNIMVHVATLFNVITKVELDDLKYTVTIKKCEYIITLTQRISHKGNVEIKRYAMTITYDEYF